jgi:intein-encoded DNA endonuclease-like protein
LRSSRGSGGEWKAKHDAIPPELIDALYSKALELARDGLGPTRIASHLHDTYSLRLSPGTLRHWIVGDRKPGRNTQRRNIFKRESSRPLSYIIGANIGDGCTLTKNWCIKLEVTDFDFASTFNTNMATLFSRTNPNKILTRNEVGRLPMYVVKYSSKQLAKLLRLPLRKLLELAFAFPREFLRGFFDAEGHVDVGAKESFSLATGAENSDKILLAKVRLLLRREFGISSRINRKRESGSLKIIRGKSFRMRRTSYSLMIRRLEDMKSFDRLVGFSIKRKDQKLKDALMISESHRWKDRSTAWRLLYMKQTREWVRR